MRQRRKDRPQFSHHMVQEVRDCVCAGYGTNAEIAEHLAAIWDDRISGEDVSRWRREHPRFNAACGNALRQANIIITSKAFELAAAGSEQMIRHWLDRRVPAFMPKSRTDIRGGGTLDDLLKQRMTEDDLRDDGTITDGEDDDGYGD